MPFGDDVAVVAGGIELDAEVGIAMHEAHPVERRARAGRGERQGDAAIGGRHNGDAHVDSGDPPLDEHMAALDRDFAHGAIGTPISRDERESSAILAEEWPFADGSRYARLTCDASLSSAGGMASCAKGVCGATRPISLILLVKLV